jgi:hypothetical protein
MLSEKENVKKKTYIYIYIYIELITSVHSMIIAPYHQTNMPIDFSYKRDLNPKSLIQ